MKFNELDKKKVSKVEESISKYWEKNEIFKKSIENRDKYFVFYDGPATANGMPGLHHMLAKFLKDTFCKYKTMQGYKVLRKVGWDTHGLPVELQVEKELGFKNKTDIEKYGIAPFNQKCRESVWRNEKAFSDFTNKIGQFIDLDNPYVTYNNNYIETEWWILKKFFDEGLFYEGHKILPFCTRCGTGLASHEVAQGYKEITATTVTVPMKKKDEDVYFLVWTTTPWTLISNVAICVNPDYEYVKVLSNGYKFILARSLCDKVLGSDYEILETYKGRDLEYMEYEQLIPSLSVNKKAFFVAMDNYVTMEDGTGIVHLAPAFGQDDYEVGKRYNLPVLNPVNEDGTYNDGIWKGKNVFEVDEEVVSYLKENDKLFKKEKMKHNYPHCWRCETPLLYYSKPSWYIAVSKIKDKIIECNKSVNWYPSYIGEKRFGNWLENLNDWAISRNRYWGTPLPLWTCSCGHMEMIGSRSELIEKATTTIDESIELHRPYIDEVHLKCPDCGKEMSRVKDVIDCWFDSGSMPFSQYHYPFENIDLFEHQFPADFICEGVDQTRGWFYTLLVISTFVMGKSPYKNVLVNDLLLDKFGKKMSKSKGNAVDPFSLIEEYGADTIRWYLPYVSPVWVPLKFDIDGLKEVYSKFFNPLRNTYNFFAIYANTDKIDPRSYEIEYSKRDEIDLWLLSKYNKLVKNVNNDFNEYDLNKVVKEITEFVSEDLSNWYIRRNRKRFWSSDLDDSKRSVYKTTYEVLVGISKLIAPIVPFVSEEIYRNLTGLESVHLADYPVVNEDLINDTCEKKMDLVRDLISIGRMVREEVHIKVRQPLGEALIDGVNKDIIGDLVTLIEEELNVKKITFIDNVTEYMNFSIKPNFKVAGPIFSASIKNFQEALNKLSNEEINNLRKGNNLDVEVLGNTYNVSSDMVDIRVTAKEGYDQGMDNGNFIILNTELTKELIEEGIARELVSKIQQLRKTNNYNITDHINIIYNGDEEVTNAINKMIDYIKQETLGDNIKLSENFGEVFDINGHNVNITLEKVN